jgi:hypothetical protein
LALSIGSATRWSIGTLADLGWPPPITADHRADFLRRVAVGYRAVEHVNNRAAPGDRVFVIGASWLNYRLAPRVVDYAGLLQHHRWPRFDWPGDRSWLLEMDQLGVQWVLVNHRDPLRFIQIPTELPLSGTFWPGFELTYRDAQMWVFQRATTVERPDD